MGTRARATVACLLLVIVAGLATAADDQAPRRIYVPVEDLDALVSRDVGGVVLTKTEFEKLLAGAEAAGQGHEPAEAVLSSAVYTGRIDGEQLVLSITIQATSFHSGWATLPLRVGGLGIESATVGEEAAIVTRGDPPEVLRWLLKDAGTSTLTLAASLPLEVVGSDRVAVFDLAGAPTGELRLTLPAGKHLQVGGAPLARPGDAAAEAEYVLPIGGHKSVELRITDRASESQADALTFASTAHGLYVAPGEVTWTAKTALQVIGRKIDRLVATVPHGVEITAIESVGLEAWELSDQPESPNRTTITLTWRQGFDGSRAITFRGVLSQLDGGEWTAPNLELKEVTSHTGVVEVQYPAGVRVQPRNVQGARASTDAAAALDGLGPPTTAVGRLRFSAWQQDYTLTFSTAAKARELHAAMTNLLDVTTDGLMLFTLVDVTPHFDSLFELQLALPAEWEVQELSVAGNAVQWTTTPVAANVNELRIPLDPALPPGESRSVRLVARRLLENWPVEQAPVRFTLPEIKLPQANVVEALYGVTGEDDLVLTPIEITGLDPARRQDLESLQKQLEGQGRTLRLGFAYQDTVFAGSIEVVRKPTRISAATLSFVELDRETVTTHLETQVRIEGGGVKELQVSLPETAGADLRFRLATVYLLRTLRTIEEAARQGAQTGGMPFIPMPQIVEQRGADPANGRRVWTLKFDRRLYGDVVLWTEVKQPRAEAQALAPLVLDIATAERQNGHIAVIAGSDQRATLSAADADGQPLPLVDPVEFPESYTFPVQALRSGRKRIVASVQYLQPGYTASVSDERYERTAVPTAVCRQATYATVVSPSGEVQHEATLELVAIGVQSLSVRLPAGDTLWAALVDGSPVEVRRTVADAGSIRNVLPLPPVAQADQVRKVQLLYRGEARPLSASGSFRQTPPEVAVVTGQGGEQPLEVLQQLWQVHHSPNTLLLESDGRFHTDGPLYAGTLLGRLGTMWQMPTYREGIWMATIAIIGLLVIVLAAAILKRCSFRGAISVLALVTVVCVVWALMLSAPLQVRKAARMDEGVTTNAPSDRDADQSRSEVPASGAAPGGMGGGGFGAEIPRSAEDEFAGGAFGGRAIRGRRSGAADQPAAAPEPAVAATLVAPPTEELARSEIMPKRDPELRLEIPAAPAEDAPAPESPPLPAAVPEGAIGFTPIPQSEDFERVGRPAMRGGEQQGRGQLSAGGVPDVPADGLAAGATWAAPSLDDEVSDNQFGYRFQQGQQPGSGELRSHTIRNNLGGEELSGVLGQFRAGLDFAEPQSELIDVAAGQGRGALLSLALALAPPDNFVSREFRYVGSETDPAAVDLDVAYADRRGAQMLLAAVAGGVLLLLWLLRKSPLAVRGLVGVAAVLGPLALASLVPPAWLVVLDGVLVGGVLGVGAWGVAGLVKRCPACCQGWREKGEEEGKRRKGEEGTQATGGHGDMATRAAGGPVGVGIWLAAFGMLLSGGIVSAEEPVPPPPPEAGRPVVIVPYEAGTDPLAAEQVLLLREYFLKLWRAARPDEQPEGDPPAAGVVAAAAYKAELEPEAEVGGQKSEVKERTVKVSARFVLRQLSDEVTRLALPLGPTAIESAVLDDRPATLAVTADGGALAVVLDKAGLHLLDVVFRVPAVNVTADSGKFTLPLRPVASGKLSFAVPAGEATEVRLNGATDAYRIRDVEGVRTLETYVDRGGDVTISWRPKTARGAGDGTISVESTIGATIDDAGLTARHRFRYVVTQGSLSDVTFTLPAGVSLKRIAGADVSGWEQADEGGLRTLKVFLRRDVDDSTSLDIDLFQPVSLNETATAVDVPTLAPVGVTREKGDVAVFAEPQLAVTTGTTSGLRQVNVANFTMDAALTQPGATARFAYRFDGRPFTLPVSFARRQPETRVETEHGAQVLLRKVLVASRFQFDLREAPRANLSFTLPAGYLPLDVQGDYLVDWSATDVDGSRVLTIELDEPRTGRVQVLLQGTQPRDAAAANVSIAVPQPVGVNRQESQLGVWIDDTFTATIGAAGDWRSLDPTELGQAIRELRPESAQFGFRSTQPAPGAVTFDLQRKQAELSGEAVLLAAASDASLDYGLNLRWRINRAAADQFVVTTPDWMGDRVEFNGEGIRQIESLPRADGGRAWRITLHEPVTEQYFLSAVSTLPLPADDRLRVPDVRFLRTDAPIDTAGELAVQRRFLVLVNLSDLHRLNPVNADAITPAQRDQLPLVMPETLLDQAVEIAALAVGQATPEWTLESTAGTQAAAATVLLADLRTVLAHDGSWRTQAEYRLRNRGRQFLAIVPPVESRLLSVVVRDQPSQATRQEVGGVSLLLVPLPATSMVDLSFTVRLVFAGRLPQALPRGLSLAATEIALPAPQVATIAQSAEFGLPVLQTLWRVDVPEAVRAAIVEGSGKSNLTPGDEQAATTLYQRGVADDLKALLSLSSINSSSRKAASKSQLDNLSIALQNAQTQTLGDDVTLNREQVELVEKGTQQLEELRQKAEQPEQADADESLARNDFGRSFIVQGNSIICEFNCPTPQAEGAADNGVNFIQNERLLSEVAKAKPEAEEKFLASKSRAAVQQQLGGQSLLYSNTQAMPAQQPNDGERLWMSLNDVESAAMARLRDTQPLDFPESWDEIIASRRGSSPESMYGGEYHDYYAGQSESSLYGTLAAGDGVTTAGVPVTAGGRQAEWTERGGLSLDMPLPRGGRELTFTKVGGDPQLTLALRPQETVVKGQGLVWALACVVLGIGILRGLTSGRSTPDGIAWWLVLAGLVLAWLLATPLRYLGLALFFAGAGWLLVRRVARS